MYILSYKNVTNLGIRIPCTLENVKKVFWYHFLFYKHIYRHKKCISNSCFSIIFTCFDEILNCSKEKFPEIITMTIKLKEKIASKFLLSNSWPQLIINILCMTCNDKLLCYLYASMKETKMHIL